MDWKGFESLQEYVDLRVDEFSLIPEKRKESLSALAKTISEDKSDIVNLIFICTHNSRRSHMAHLWASLGASVYGAERVACYSGGTEVSAFNSMAVNAIKSAGFGISVKIPGANPVYLLSYPGSKEGVRVFSKKYTDPPNPTRNFHAVMTCSNADDACPIVTGAASRHVITYEDPKASDGTPQVQEVYDERCRQISREMLYLFSLTN